MPRQGSIPGLLFSSDGQYRPGAGDAVGLAGALTAILSISAGVVHVSAAADHANLPVMQAGFLVVATLQVALGGALLWRRPSRVLIAAAVALMATSIAIWTVARTAGLPFLPGGHMEPIGFKDGVCKMFELASIAGLLLLGSRELPKVSLPPRLGMQAIGVVGAGAFALLVPALVLEGGAHHSHAEAVALGIHEHDHGGAAAAEHAEVHAATGHVQGEDLPAVAGEAAHADHAHHHAAGVTPAATSFPVHMHGAASHGTADVHTDGHMHRRSGAGPQHHHGAHTGHGVHMGHTEATHDDAAHAAGGHGGHAEQGGSDDDISLTYEPAQPGRGGAVVFRSPNGPYEHGAHSGEHGRQPNCHPTAEQQAAADKLYRDTVAALRKYENNPAAALADGFYQAVGPADRFVHMINDQRVFDSTILDAAKIESFMYAMTDRGLVPIGGMYIMPAELKGTPPKVVPKEPTHGPEIVGCLTHWHKHGGWVAGFTTGGTNWEETPEMLHVWTYPGLDPWGHYGGRELSQLWAPWKDVPSVCRISVPDGTDVCFP